MFIFIFI